MLIYCKAEFETNDDVKWFYKKKFLRDSSFESFNLNS